MINATKNDLCPWHQRELFCAKLLLYTQFLVCENLRTWNHFPNYRVPTRSYGVLVLSLSLSVCLSARQSPTNHYYYFANFFPFIESKAKLYRTHFILIYAPRPTTLFLLNHPSDCLPAHHQPVVAEAGNSTIRLDKSVGAPKTEQEPDRQQTGESILSQVDIIKCPASDIPCPPPLFL